MSIVTYNYDLIVNWKIHGTINPSNSDAALISDVATNINAPMVQAFGQAFASKFPIGHWFKVNSSKTLASDVQITARGHYGAPNDWIFEGKSAINFDTDVANANQQMSPDTLVDILIIIAAVTLSILTAGTISFVFLLVAAAAMLALVTEGLLNTGTHELTTIGNNIGALILALAILGFGGLAIYALFFTKTGGRVASEGASVARRGYRAARRRLN